MAEIHTDMTGLYLDHLADTDYLALHAQLGSQPTLLKPEYFGVAGWPKAMLEERRVMGALCPGFTQFGIIKGEEPVGEICVFPQPDEPAVAEISWEVIEAHQRRGYATVAARAIVIRGMEDLNLLKVYAKIPKDNEASKKVALRAGLSQVNSKPGLLVFTHDLDE
jgi:RimJ/RimL family protein N-acetyltransferase